MLSESKQIAANLFGIKTSALETNSVVFPHMKNSRVLATRENLETLMRHCKVDVKYDVIKKMLVVNGIDAAEGDEENAVIAHLKSLCAFHGLSKHVVDEQLTAIAHRNLYNPVVEWLSSLKRKKHGDPISELVDDLFVLNKAWVKIAFKRWFLQCVAAADNAEKTPHKTALSKYESILTFYGFQGVGKSSFIRALLPTEIKLHYIDGHLLDLNNKDSIMQALQGWIVELGELDSTFRRSDISALKAFMSKSKDVIRLPYAKASTTMPRQTSFIASVNEEKYLRDTTGNRRYFPVTVTSKLLIPDGFDTEDFWAYIWESYLLGEQWWLTPEEESIQLHALSEHQHLDYEELLLDAFDFDCTSRENLLTGLEILHQLGQNNTRAEQTKLGSTLKGLGVERRKDRRYCMPPLPTRL